MCLCVSICTNIYPYVPFCTQIYLCTNMFLYNVPYKYTYKTFTKIIPPWYQDSPHDTMPLDTTLYDSPHLSSQRQTEWRFTIGEWQYIDEWCLLQNYTQSHTTLYPTFPPYCNCISNCIQAPTEGNLPTCLLGQTKFPLVKYGPVECLIWGMIQCAKQAFIGTVA